MAMWLIAVVRRVSDARCCARFLCGRARFPSVRQLRQSQRECVYAISWRLGASACSNLKTTSAAAAQDQTSSRIRQPVEELVERDRIARWRKGHDRYTHWSGPTHGSGWNSFVLPKAVNAQETALRLEAALAGLGLGYLLEDQVLTHLSKGWLVRILEDWCPSPFAALHHHSRS
jgi:DNA-binding transcriptional LysR family regulator